MTSSPLTEALVAGERERSALVDVRGLTVAFPGRRGEAPTVALDDVDLRVGDGEFVAIVGPSGCGKSTLLRVLAGLLTTGVTVGEGGQVRVPLTAEGKRSVAWMPQRDSLLPWRRGLANAQIGAVIAGVPKAEARRQAEELFVRFGLAGFEHAWPNALSGGMRQRLALLRTVLAGRPVLLLDEPFGALDAITRRHLNEWLASIALAHDDEAAATRPGHATRAVVLVTHDVDEAVLLADRVLVMRSRPGRFIAEVAAKAPGARETILGHLADATD